MYCRSRAGLVPTAALAPWEGRDTFVFDLPLLQAATTWAAETPAGTTPPVSHILDQSAAQHDVLDLTAFHFDLSPVRVSETADGHEATLEAQVPAASDQAPHWTTVAALDGVRDGDPVLVLLDQTVALADLHATGLYV